MAKKKAQKKKPVKSQPKKLKAKTKVKLKAKPKAKPKVQSKSKPAAKVAKKTTTFDLLFSPLGNRVLVERDITAEKTPGGLFIPTSALDKPIQGKVLAVGTGVRTKKGIIRPLDVRVGDEVMFNKHAGSQIKIVDKDYLLVSENEIIGVVTKSFPS
jgi:chaperonin GroES